MPAPEIEVGDHVKLRGREPKGEVIQISVREDGSKGNFVRVRWDGYPVGPVIVDINELEHTDG